MKNIKKIICFILILFIILFILAKGTFIIFTFFIPNGFNNYNGRKPVDQNDTIWVSSKPKISLRIDENLDHRNIGVLSIENE